MTMTAYGLIFSAGICSCTSAVITATNAQSNRWANLTYKDPLNVYEEFLHAFDLESSRADVDSVSRSTRRVLFQARHEEVQKHNAHEGRLWTATINHFADYTDSERLAMLGHKPMPRMRGGIGNFAASKLFSVERHSVANRADWTGLQSSAYIRNQGQCGSCWAVAAAGTIEMRYELENGGKTTRLSHLQLVDCVSNPGQCGGRGGCDGATAELAFDFVMRNGISFRPDYRPGVCEASDAQVKVGSYRLLPQNEDIPLMEALGNSGPVVGSVDATNWFSYASGVYNSCQKDATVNHAIILMGYGHDPSLDADYWLIRNSWGAEWGEMGYIRLFRHADSSQWCGTDYNPEEGNGCAGGPTQVPVCGMCGILSDSSYPVAVRIAQVEETKERTAKYAEHHRNLRSTANSGQ